MRQLILTLILLSASITLAQNAPAAQPSPLTPASPIDPILQALHARGVGLKDFSADVSMAEIDALGGDTIDLSGKVWYQSLPNGDARIRVLFDRRKTGNKIDNQARLEYMPNNGILIERNYKQKLQVDRQVLKPGQKINLLKLGEGPFPLPIGQPPDEVAKAFIVEKIAPAKDDPPGSPHIRLIPKPGTQFERKFHRIDVWVNPTHNFPDRIETEDRNQTEVRVTTLSNIQLNQSLTDQQFTLEKVQGFTVKQEDMPE